MATAQRSTNNAIPPYHMMLWPTLLALRDLGDSGSIQEIDDRASDIAGFSDEQRSILHGDGPQTEVRYRMAWARTYLKAVGALENSGRGVWSITDYGRDLTVDEVKDIPARVRARLSKNRKVGKGSKVERNRPDSTASSDDSMSPAREPVDDGDWRADLLSVLQAMHPSSFEKLCQRVLRESGFTRSKSLAEAAMVG